MTLQEKTTNLMASMFAKHMMTDPYGEYFSIEDINGEKDSNLVALPLKIRMYKEVSRMIYEDYSTEEILAKIDELVETKDFTDLSEYNKEKIVRNTRNLVLERKERLNYE